MKKYLIILGIALLLIVVFASLYKLIYEPYALKKQYLSCVDSAKDADYHRWQDIEKEITDKDKQVKEKGLKKDEDFKYFLANYKSTSEYSDFLNSCRSHKEDLWKRLTCGDDPDEEYRSIELNKMQNEVNSIQWGLNDLYKKRDENGKFLEKDLAICQEQYRLFK